MSLFGSSIRGKLLSALVLLVAVMILLGCFVLFTHMRVVSNYNRQTGDIIQEYRISDLVEQLIATYSRCVQNPDDQVAEKEFTRHSLEIDLVLRQLDERTMDKESYVAYRGLKNSVRHIQEECASGLLARHARNFEKTERIYQEVSRKEKYVAENAARLILAEISYAAAQQQRVRVLNNLRFVVLIILMGLVVFFCLSYARSVSKRLTSPLVELTTMSNRISGGNVGVEVKRDLLDRTDEVGTLSRSFNQMLVNLRQKIDELNNEVKIRIEAEHVAEKASESKSLFLANMSHELRTPMNAIIGFSSLLQKADLQGDERLYMEGIQRSAKALLGIISDILDFSKIEAGKMELENVPFNLRETVNSALAIVGYMTKEKGLALNVTMPQSFPEWVRGDATRIFQILMNLLNNAVKFTRDGSVDLVLEVREVADASTKELRFIVQDTGIGISAERIARIMAPFEQADLSHTRQYGGTGLGLSISRSLCELMKGSLDVSSEEGKGSRFCFTVTVAVLEPDSRLVRNMTQSPQETQLLNTFRILVADDDLTNQIVAQSMLRNLGYDCDLVADGIEVLEAMEKTQYDIVFMDVQMPRLDGIEATLALREKNKRFPWIIGLTANATTEDRASCLRAGMNDYLAKPIEQDQLKQVLLEVEVAL